MKLRIITDGARFRIQRKFLFFWVLLTTKTARSAIALSLYEVNYGEGPFDNAIEFDKIEEAKSSIAQWFGESATVVFNRPWRPV